MIIELVINGSLYMVDKADGVVMAEEIVKDMKDKYAEHFFNYEQKELEPYLASQIF